jgi:hypothetical protein
MRDYLYILFWSRTIINPILRIFESQFLAQLSHNFNRLTGKGPKKNLNTIEDDPDIVFLSSSLNNLLVCGLLKGIDLCLADSLQQGIEPNES